jgi:hypothetical protein
MLLSGELFSSKSLPRSLGSAETRGDGRNEIKRRFGTELIGGEILV